MYKKRKNKIIGAIFLTIFLMSATPIVVGANNINEMDGNTNFCIDAFTNAEISIPGDINGDGVVNVVDLLILLGEWGKTDSPADVNGDGIVNVEDLLILLGNWG